MSNNQRNDKIIEFLLEHKANTLLPTLEKSPLVQAILLNDISLISLIAKFSLFEKETLKNITSILCNTPSNILDILKKIPISQIAEKKREIKEKNELDVSIKLKPMINKICNNPLKCLKRLEYNKKAKGILFPMKFWYNRKCKKNKKKKSIICKNNNIKKNRVDHQINQNRDHFEFTIDSKFTSNENKIQHEMSSQIKVMNINYKTIDLKPLEDGKEVSRNINFDSKIKINDTITKNNNYTNEENLKNNNNDLIYTEHQVVT